VRVVGLVEAAARQRDEVRRVRVRLAPAEGLAGCVALAIDEHAVREREPALGDVGDDLGRHPLTGVIGEREPAAVVLVLSLRPHLRRCRVRVGGDERRGGGHEVEAAPWGRAVADADGEVGRGAVSVRADLHREHAAVVAVARDVVAVLRVAEHHLVDLEVDRVEHQLARLGIDAPREDHRLAVDRARREVERDLRVEVLDREGAGSRPPRRVAGQVEAAGPIGRAALAAAFL
jgi:hypothetical protein